MKIKKLLLLMTIISSNALADQYVPIVEKGVFVTRSGIKCNFSKDFDETTGSVDFCDGNGSVDIRFNLSQMRSVQSSSSGKFTENKKYFQITIDNDKPGAGFHLTNDLKQGYSWWQSWAHRYDYLGGFSKDYVIGIEPIRGYVPKMLRSIPDNENKNYQHRDTSGFSIGVSGKAGADIGSQGPKVSAEVGASYSYTKSRTLVFDTKDYKIVNRSSGSKYDVAFEFDREICNTSNSQSTTSVFSCLWQDLLWGHGWTFDAAKINPIAYANFKPNGEVLYEAPVEQIGSTTFRLKVGFSPMVVYGKVLPSTIYQVGSYDGSKWKNHTFYQDIVVDWGHPSFEAEAHVAIQSLDSNNLCLAADSSNSNVTPTECQEGNWQQIWGLDKDGRYHSRAISGSCLQVNSDNTLSINQCSQSLNQKWYWNDETLMSRYVDGSEVNYALNMEDNSVTIKPATQKPTRLINRLADVKF